MKACSYCGQDVKDSCTVCPTCKRPITAPDAEVFPDLRAPKKRKPSTAEEAARLEREEAERKAQEAIAPDDPAAELHDLERQGYNEARSKKTLAAAAYTGILFFVPWYACKDKKYGTFHANQGLLVLIALIIGFVMDNAIGAENPGRSICFGYFGGLFYLMVLGIIRGFQGKMIPLPLIGGITIIKYKPPKEDKKTGKKNGK